MNPVRTVDDATREAAVAFAGELLRPSDAGYDEARRVHNGLIDKHPALIARCHNTSDVVEAIKLRRDLGLEVAVRGGGHNVAGRATIDGGIMIDLSPMKKIEVDAERRTVRAQAGVTWGELNRKTQLHGLAVTGGVVSTTGIAGLTLGGGLGWLMGKFGLTLDNLLSAELVDGKGNLLRASSVEEPDLFWAIRGGGGNFGVVTEFEFQLHPVGPNVTAGPVIHAFEHARELLAFYREMTAALPDELTIFAALTHAPDGSPAAAMVACHCGPSADGEEATRPLRQFGSPIRDGIGAMPYSDVNSMIDASFPKGALNYWKSNFLIELSDRAIATILACFADCPTPMSQILLEHVHGAATRVPSDATAFAHRREGYNFLALAQWTDPDATERCIAWARSTYKKMEPFFAPGRYVNYLGDDESGGSVAAAYGSNYARLQQVKAKYDPDNLFRMNQNIQPRAQV